MIASGKHGSAAARLAANLDEVLGWIQSSPMPASIKADLVEFLQLRLDGAAGQAESARQRSQDHKRRIDRAIEVEGRLLPPEQTMHLRAGLVAARIQRRLEAHQLKRVPSERRISSGLRALERKVARVVSESNRHAEPATVVAE